MTFNAVNFGLQTSDVVGLTPDQRTAVEFQMVFSVSARGFQKYENFRYPRFRNFYGWAQIMSGAFVVRNVELLHLNQEIVHFRDEVFGITETVGCYAKAIASALTPPSVLVTNSVLTRQRITSVRFRLMPTVAANVSLVWETGQAQCGGNVLSPDPLQGKPPAPNNSNSDPGTRPSAQGGDNEDPSNNDGNNVPNDGVPDAPIDTGVPPGLNGQWFAVYSGYRAGCNGTYSGSRFPLPGATFSFPQPVFVRTMGGSCGDDSYGGTATYNGAVVDTPRDVTSYTFDFVAS